MAAAAVVFASSGRVSEGRSVECHPTPVADRKAMLQTRAGSARRGGEIFREQAGGGGRNRWHVASVTRRALGIPKRGVRPWDLTTRDPERVADLSHKEIMTQAGAQAVALIMWLVMRGQWCRQSNSCRGVEDLWSGLSPRSVCHGRVLHQLYAQSFWSALQLIIAQSRPSPPNFGAADDRLNGGT
jgi:hypothetical protein